MPVLFLLPPNVTRQSGGAQKEAAHAGGFPHSGGTVSLGNPTLLTWATSTPARSLPQGETLRFIHWTVDASALALEGDTKYNKAVVH